MPLSSTVRHARPAFTLVEVLVAVAIIALLATIVVVVSSKAFKTADAARLGLQLQTIEQALEAYKTDFSRYPIYEPTTPTVPGTVAINEQGYRGARLLCKALIAPGKGVTSTPYIANDKDQDGADGPGFRVMPKSGVARFTTVTPPATPEMIGKKYGPYLNTDAFKVSKTYSALGTPPPTGAKAGDLNTANPDTFDDSTVILDANDKPILYYPVLNPQPTFQNQDAYVGAGTNDTTPSAVLPMYRSSDNDGWLPAPAMRKELGMGPAEGYGAASPLFNPMTAQPPTADNRKLDPTETAAVKGKYILWTAGPDGIFGPNLASKKPNEVDDVTNFQR